MTAPDKSTPPEALARMHAAIVANAATLHGIGTRTGQQHVASEVLRLNDAVRTAAEGRLDSRAQPGDFASMLLAHAERTARDIVTCPGVESFESSSALRAPAAPSTAPSAGASSIVAGDAHAICFASIAAIGRQLRRGAVTATQLTQTVLERAYACQPAHRAFIAMHGDAALAQAEQCDADMRAGHWRGPLHGVPLAHKDCFERDGAPMTVGSNVPASPGAGVTATVLARLTAAGAIDLGPLNMNEMVCGPTGQNPHFGDCTNAWDATRTSGGSSSGSAVAVALGAAFGSLGSDTGGSIRLPASMNGVFGLKPTYGRVSRHGCFPRAFSLDCVGPLARSAHDCAILLGAVAGYDPQDPTSTTSGVPDYAGELLHSAANGSRVGILVESEPCDADISAVFAAFTHGVAERYGKAATMPFDARGTCYAMGDIMSKVEAATLHGDWMRRMPERYSQAVYSRTEPGLHVPAVRYLEAMLLRARILDDFLRGPMAHCDVLIMPTVPLPVPLRADADMESGDKVFNVVAALTRSTRAFNYLGLPVLSMPIGLDANGMPVGAQLIARPFDEARLLAMAHALSHDIGWANTFAQHLTDRS